MGLLKNKKGVEALPLRYIIIALVAALVIGIALQFTGILKEGIMGSADRINDSLTEKTICELDDEEPIISDLSVICNETTEMISVVVKLEDECGIDRVSFDLNDDDVWVGLELKNGTIQGGYWYSEDYNYTEHGGFSNNEKIEISAFDKTTAENWGYLAETISCD